MLFCATGTSLLFYLLNRQHANEQEHLPESVRLIVTGERAGGDIMKDRKSEWAGASSTPLWFSSLISESNIEECY